MKLPYLTAELPGSGGLIKTEPGDFEVEELPLYEPSGTGTHSYFWIEKDGLTTFEAIRLLARTFARREHEFGYAGLKDATARTRQWLSLEHVRDCERLENRLPSNLRVLRVANHGNKLRIGHLRGNRFIIRVRGVVPDALARARAVMDVLERVGVPAFFGAQRFGMHASTHELGKALVRGDADTFLAKLLEPMAGESLELVRRGEFARALAVLEPGRVHRYEREALTALKRCGGDATRAVDVLDRRLLRLYVSAYQSYLFNRILEHSLARIDRVAAGDIAFLHRNGACFRVIDVAREQERAQAFEISPTGPLYGPDMLQPDGEALVLEQRVLSEEGVTQDQFSTRRLRLTGARRPLRTWIREAAMWTDGEHLMARFVLPPGMYASVVMGEITKSDAALALPLAADAGE